MDDPRSHGTFSRWRAKVRPPPGQTAPVALVRSFSPDEMMQIVRGLVPRHMEDKWFIFLEVGVLHFVRSWTGFRIFEVTMRPTADGGGDVQSAWVNRDSTQYGGEDVEYDAALLAFLFDNLLLGRGRPFPLLRGEAPSPVPGAGLYQHHLTGTGYPELEHPWVIREDGTVPSHGIRIPDA